jgi:CheY-like chemotaxis protein
MKKVLVVEDDPAWRLLLTVIIEQTGYDVTSASGGRDGVALATLNHPDLILMDLGLPNMSGDEAIAQIKGNPDIKDIPPWWFRPLSGKVQRHNTLLRLALWKLCINRLASATSR